MGLVRECYEVILNGLKKVVSTTATVNSKKELKSRMRPGDIAIDKAGKCYLLNDEMLVFTGIIPKYTRN